MGQNDVQKIKERLNIKEVAETYIKLEKSGKNYKARCPFHNEKTPSFFISPDRDSYYCFGCGAKGDIFTFVQHFEGVDFPSALKILAERAGVEIQKISPEVRKKMDRQREILETATEFFEFQLQMNEEPQEYLKKRGLKKKTIKEWRVGFVPGGWKNLLTHLKNKGYKEEEIEKVGLIKKGNKGDYYDRFRSRIMFPIFDPSGKPVAFTGRIFGPEDDMAKYINSPETVLFKKSDIIYGFHLAKSPIRKNNFSILVEGQVDVLMCHQMGYSNTIATSGTALTESQLKMISRISQRMVIAYDSDSAGFKASERAWQMALALGMDIKIAPIPNGLDPADLILKKPKEWKGVIKNSKHIVEVLIEKIQQESGDSRQIGQEISQKIIPYLAMIESEIDKAHFLKKVSDSLNVSEEAIKAELNKYESKEGKEVVGELEQKKGFKERERDSLAIEKKLLGIIYWQKKAKDKVINPSTLEEKVKEILKDSFEEIQSEIKDILEVIAFTLEDSYAKDEILEKDVEELVSNLKLKYLIKQREKLLIELKKAESSGDEGESDKVLKKIGDISQEVQKLTNLE